MNGLPKKFSIVLSGGGMRCSWSAGFLVALMDMSFVPTLIIAKSGNAGNAVYVATHQTSLIKRIWTKHLTDKKFINWLRFWKVIDIDFLIDEVLTKKEPMNLPSLRNSSIKVMIACFNNTTQKIDYFPNETISFEVLKATKAMPFVYRKKISINDCLYTDQPFSPYQIINDKKEELGEKILLIDVREKSLFYQKLISFIGDKTNIKEEYNKNILKVTPDSCSASLLVNSENIMEKSYEEGYKHAFNQKKIMYDFLRSD